MAQEPPPQGWGPQGGLPPSWQRQQAPQGWGGGPPSKKSNRSGLIILGILVFLVLLAFIGALSGGTNGDNTTGRTSNRDEAPHEEPTRNERAEDSDIGRPVRDGKFEFTVISVACGETEVGTGTFTKSAQGEYCMVKVSIANIGEESQSLFGDNQYLFDSQDRKFSADSEAAIYMPDSKTLYEEINPGNSVNGILIYDVPKGTTPRSLELHDSAFSGGVTVTL